MKNFSKRLLTVMTALVIFLSPTLVSAEASTYATPEDNEIIILHTNDMHGQITTDYELAYVKAYKDHVSATAVIDAGDAFQGLPLNNLTKGAKLAEIMDAIGYDAMAIGNHEFDYTRDVALGLSDGWAKSAEFSLLSSNIIYDDASLGTVGETVYKAGVVLADKKDQLDNDLKISVIGASTPETYVKADPRHTEGLKIIDPVAAVKAEIVKADYQDSDIYIVTAHLGTDKETKASWRGDTLAEELSQMPELANKRVIVVDGHSHTAYPEGKKYGNNVLYGQTGSSLNNLGKITINLDDFTKSKAELVQIREGYGIGEIQNYLTPDPGIKNLIDAADAEFDDLTKEILLDNTPVALNGERESVRTRETNLGNLITDSMLDYALDTFDDKTDVAVLNGGGIRKSLEKGKQITLKEVLSVMPYGNRLVQIDVTGEELYAMYEHALKAPIHESEVDENGLPLLTSDPAILHSSDSIRVHFDPRLTPGERVFKIELMDTDGNMKKVDLNKTYKVVTLEFLAVGGDGYSMLGGPRVEGANDADAFANYLREENESPFIEWSAYDPALPPYRVVPTSQEPETETPETEKPETEKPETETPVEENEKPKTDIPNTGIYTATLSSISTATIAAAGLYALRKRKK